MASYTYSISVDFPNGKVDSYRLKLEIENSSIAVALDRIDTNGDECVITFKAVLSGDEKTILDGIVANHSGEPVKENIKTDSIGRLVTVSQPELDRDMVIVCTHDFCDKTTWFQDSARVTDQELVNSGNGLKFNSPNNYWIDLVHGKYYQEDRIENKESLYGVEVKVDGVVKNPREPFTSDGGDYRVDYEDGSVEFFEEQTGTVTASYSYAQSSLFKLQPDAGKVLWVTSSEVQFSVDAIVRGGICFQGWAYNPNDLPNKAPATKLTKYKGMRDFIYEARGCYPVVPRMGGEQRGLMNDHVTFPFNYLQIKELKSSIGVEIRVWIDNDEEFGGEFGTATFYCVSYDEQFS